MENLLEKMNKLAGGSDVEANHCEADRLLVDALVLLSEKLSDDDKLVVSELVTAFNRVERWFA